MIKERKLVYSSAINKNVIHSMEHIQKNVGSENGEIALKPYFPNIFASNVREYDIAESYVEFCLPHAINKILHWKNNTYTINYATNKEPQWKNDANDDCNLKDIVAMINNIIKHGSINTHFNTYTHFPANQIEELNGDGKLESMNHGLSSGAVLVAMLFADNIRSEVDDFYFTENIGILNSYFANTFLMLRKDNATRLLPTIPYIENEVYLSIAGEFFDNFVNDFELSEIELYGWYLENEAFKKASTYEYIMSIGKLIDS